LARAAAIPDQAGDDFFTLAFSSKSAGQRQTD